MKTLYIVCDPIHGVQIGIWKPGRKLARWYVTDTSKVYPRKLTLKSRDRIEDITRNMPTRVLLLKQSVVIRYDFEN